jgi:hypothetical protein
MSHTHSSIVIVVCYLLLLLFSLTNLIAVTPETIPLAAWQKVLYGVLTIGGEWGWSRLCRYSVTQGWGDMEEV